MKSLLTTIFTCLTGILLFSLPSFSKINESFEPSLKIEIIPPTVPDLYSECQFPEASIRISNCGKIKSKVTVEARVSHEAEIISDGWTKSGTGRWIKSFQVNGIDEFRFKVGLNLINKSNLDQLKLGISIIDGEKQSTTSNESQLCSRSVVNLNNSENKTYASQLVSSHRLTSNSSECGLKTYYLEGEMIIDEDLEINNAATHFIVAPGSVIKVEKGVTFSVNNTSFSCCGNWQGIDGENGSNIVLKNTIIEGGLQPAKVSSVGPHLLQKDDVVQISPNPGISTVTIQSTQIGIEHKYSVYAEDMQGRSYCLAPTLSAPSVNKGEMSLDVSLLPNGFYILKITSLSDNAFLTGKMVVTH